MAAKRWVMTKLWKQCPSRDADGGSNYGTDTACSRTDGSIEAQVTCVLRSTFGSPKWEDASPDGSGNQSLSQVPGIDRSITTIVCDIPSGFEKGTSSWAGASLNW